VAGYRNGYYSEEEEPGIAEMIRDSMADMLFVGFLQLLKRGFSIGGCLPCRYRSAWV
jgi:hypothetical protein